MFREKNSTVVLLEHWKRFNKKKKEKSQNRINATFYRHAKYYYLLSLKREKTLKNPVNHFILLISSLMDRFDSRFTYSRIYAHAHTPRIIVTYIAYRGSGCLPIQSILIIKNHNFMIVGRETRPR